jgi:phosphatidylcholine synthase
VVVFYLLLLRPSPVLAGAAIVLLAVLTFVPITFVHPFRVRALRPVTVGLLAAWAALAGAALARGLAPEAWITAALCLIAVYFLVFGLLAHRRAST